MIKPLSGLILGTVSFPPTFPQPHISIQLLIRILHIISMPAHHPERRLFLMAAWGFGALLTTVLRSILYPVASTISWITSPLILISSGPSMPIIRPGRLRRMGGLAWYIP